MEIFKEWIKPELLILVPVLYVIGNWLVGLAAVKNKYIPLLLGAFGILLSLIYILAASQITTWRGAALAVFTGVTQGILAAGCSVYVDQILKQSKKDE